MSKNLWDNNDSIMVEGGFTINKEFEPLNVKLNIHVFMSGERAITQIKTFQVLNDIPLSLAWACKLHLDSWMYFLQFFTTNDSKEFYCSN